MPPHFSSFSSGGPQPVTYGSEIQLIDSLSGITTNPLIIRKVDKGKVSSEDGGPVSQMQKIALQRINADRSRSYLSAAGPVPGASVPGVPTPLPGNVSQPASHPLLFQAPRVREEVKDGLRIVTDEVDDYLCWTIVGICEPRCHWLIPANLFDLSHQPNFNTRSLTRRGTTLPCPVYPSRLFLHFLLPRRTVPLRIQSNLQFPIFSINIPRRRHSVHSKSGSAIWVH